MFIRFLFSLGAVGALSVINTFLSNTGRVLSGEVAVHQFDNSDTSYITSQSMMAHMTNWHLSIVLLFIILLMIWWKPIKSLFSH